MISFEDFKLDENAINSSTYSQYRLDREYIFILKVYGEWKAINQLKHCLLDIYMQDCVVEFEAIEVEDVIEKFNSKEAIIKQLED